MVCTDDRRCCRPDRTGGVSRGSGVSNQRRQASAAAFCDAAALCAVCTGSWCWGMCSVCNLQCAAPAWCRGPLQRPSQGLSATGRTVYACCCSWLPCCCLPAVCAVLQRCVCLCEAQGCSTELIAHIPRVCRLFVQCMQGTYHMAAGVCLLLLSAGLWQGGLAPNSTPFQSCWLAGGLFGPLAGAPGLLWPCRLSSGLCGHFVCLCVEGVEGAEGLLWQRIACFTVCVVSGLCSPVCFV